MTEDQFTSWQGWHLMGKKKYLYYNTLVDGFVPGILFYIFFILVIESAVITKWYSIFLLILINSLWLALEYFIHLSKWKKFESEYLLHLNESKESSYQS